MPSLQSTGSQIAKQIQHSPRGTVFTPHTFTVLGSRAAIDKALQRLVAEGKLRRLSRGLYDKPRRDELLGVLWPSVDAVVRALMGKDRLRVQPTGGYAANLLGLSEQVPARIVFLTDGASRTVRAGPIQIELRRASPRTMAAGNRTTGLVIQALKNLGREHISPERLAHLRATLPRVERVSLLRDLSLAPEWMRPFLRELAKDEPESTPSQALTENQP